jgi:hypothetical protein
MPFFPEIMRSKREASCSCSSRTETYTRRYGKNIALLAPWGILLEYTADRELLLDFLVFMRLAVFEHHGGAGVTAVKTSV